MTESGKGGGGGGGMVVVWVVGGKWEKISFSLTRLPIEITYFNGLTNRLLISLKH